MPALPNAPHQRYRAASLLFALLLSAMLQACGGGGGSASDTSTTPVVTDTPLSTLTLTLPTHGFGPSDLAVIVASGDPVSEAMAVAYQKARGIPDANMIRVAVPTGDSISSDAFTALKAAIDAKLPASAQATLLAWNSPSRVAGPACSMSITSAMAFGYNASYCSATCTATRTSTYFNTQSNKPFRDLAMRPSMMLARTSADDAARLIRQGIDSDNSQPTGDGWLIRTSDADRSPRYTDFQPLPSLWSGTLALNYVDNSNGLGLNWITGQSNVLFYFTGLPTIPLLTTNSFRPGAIADSLTSYAGVLPNSLLGQMPVTQWLDAGVTASYGTVEEPCNFTAKFPQASVLIDQYWRGATVIEAYWKSVSSPGQGLFIGEPLAQPFRDAPSFTISGNNYVISTRSLRPSSRYEVDYRTTSNGSWITLAAFTTAARAQVQNLQAPRPPATAVQIRWMGPCPNNASQSCTLASSP